MGTQIHISMCGEHAPFMKNAPVRGDYSIDCKPLLRSKRYDEPCKLFWYPADTLVEPLTGTRYIISVGRAMSDGSTQARSVHR